LAISSLVKDFPDVSLKEVLYGRIQIIPKELYGLLIHLYLQNGYLAFIMQGGNWIGNEYIYFF